MKIQLPILIGISLLLAFSLVAGAYLVVYHHDYEVKYKELDIVSKQYEDGVLTITVASALDGEFLYSVEGAENEDGNYELTFLGGKQPALAQKPGKAEAVFRIPIPDGYEKVVCGTTTLYTIS